MLRGRQSLKIIYNIDMNGFVKTLSIICLIIFSVLPVKAETYKILVLPDNIQFESTNYYIYPDSSIIFASDIINEIKKGNQIETVSMAEIRDALRKDTKLSILTKKALKEFKYNYNIPFVDFRAIARTFSTDKVLVITSQTDVQNYLLRRTLWDFLNIPGAAVIDPAYKLSTYAALIDVEKEQVLWQNTYYKKIASVENRMIATTFAPATQQLEKIKSYSMYFLSPQMASIAQSKILPPPSLTPDGNIVNVSNKIELPKIEMTKEEIELKYKAPVPVRTNNESYGVIINDL